MFCLLVVLRLSVPVQVIDWKDSSLKWPIMCWWGRLTLLTHSLTHWLQSKNCGRISVESKSKHRLNHLQWWLPNTFPDRLVSDSVGIERFTPRRIKLYNFRTFGGDKMRAWISYVRFFSVWIRQVRVAFDVNRRRKFSFPGTCDGRNSCVSCA